MQQFHLRSTGHVTLYITSGYIEMQRKCFCDTFVIYHYLDTPENHIMRASCQNLLAIREHFFLKLADLFFYGDISG